MSTRTSAAKPTHGIQVYETALPEVAEAKLLRRRAAIQLADYLIGECSGPRTPNAQNIEFASILSQRYSAALLDESAAGVTGRISAALRSVEPKKAGA